jgi:hypothetical protein
VLRGGEEDMDEKHGGRRRTDISVAVHPPLLAPQRVSRQILVLDSEEACAPGRDARGGGRGGGGVEDVGEGQR